MRNRPVLLYDGDCAFCTSSIRLVERYVEPRAEITAWQFADLDGLGVTQERAEHELLWITPAGAVHGGAQAVAKALMNGRRGWAPLGALLMLPPVRQLAHGVYRLVADNRARMPGGTAACALPAAQRPGAAR
jgi:predicted DCC family thiol-disulfide oxidoreductase YuxK